MAKNDRIKKTDVSVTFLKSFEFWNSSLQTKIRNLKEEAANKKSWKTQYVNDIFDTLCLMATAIKNLKGEFDDKH